MKRTVFLYALAVAVAAFLLSWLDYRHAVRSLSIEVYLTAVGAGFLALGIWVGVRLTRRVGGGPFEANRQALEYLGITEREREVLELLARGLSNREIAKGLFVSTNTVKTHLAHLYGKLQVSRRTQAVHKAKALRLIP